MVAPVPGDPPDPDRIQVILDPDDPTKSDRRDPAAAAGGDDAGLNASPAPLQPKD